MIGVIFVSFLYSQVDSLIDTNRVDTTTFAPYKLTDFRMPESGAMKLSVNLIGEKSDFSNSHWYLPYDSLSDTVLYKRRIEQIDGTTGGGFTLERDKEKFRYSIFTGVTIANRSRKELTLRDISGPDTFINTIDRNTTGNISIFGEILYYPFGDIIFVGTGYSLDNGCSFTRDEYYLQVDSFVPYSYLSFARSYGDTLSLNPVIGFGRIRSLTYASNALEIAEVLQRKYTAARNPQLVKEVAELYAKRWEYPIKYWHPNWEFYEDLEEIFTKYGIPREEISIRDWMEVIDASNVWTYVYRNYGIKVTFTYANLNQIYYTNSSRYVGLPFTVTRTFDRLDLGFEASEVMLSWGYPLSSKTNLEGSAEVSFYPGFEFFFHHDATRSPNQDPVVFDTTVRTHEIEGYRVNYAINSTTYIWNHLVISPGLSGFFEKDPNYYAESRTRLWINNGVSLSARYYFTNKFAFGVSGGMYVGFERINSLPFTYSLYPNADVSLYYRIF